VRDPAIDEEPQRYIELAERAYKEVLDATKHQDDKVGRFLTAIAFLTTGSIALLATGEGLRRTFDVPSGGGNPLLAWSTGGFFALTLAAVALLLLCLSVPVRLPKTVDDDMKGSHLFYSYIASRPRDEWARHWKKSSRVSLEEKIAGDYVREAHNLAERTSAKYRHSYEASWLFVCALLFLGVSIYLKLIAEFRVATDEVVSLTTSHLVGLAGIASLHAALQIYTRWVHDIRSMDKARDFAERPKGTEPSGHSDADRRRCRNVAMYRQRRWTLSLVVSTSVFSLALALPVQEWRFGRELALASIALAAMIPTWLTRPRWDEEVGAKLKCSKFEAWWPTAFTTAGALMAAAAVLLSDRCDGVWRVAAILLPPLVMGAINCSRPGRSQGVARRMRLKRSASAAS
jgi:hypothetical protein